MTGLTEKFERLLASDPDAMRDATEIFIRLRDAGAVHKIGNVLYLTRHEHVRFLLGDLDHFRMPVFEEYEDRVAAELALTYSDEELEAFSEVGKFEQNYMNRSGDGEAHDRLRRIAHRYFRSKRIAGFEDSILRYTTEILDELVAGSETGEFDITQLAWRLPLMVICDMLGIPDEDRDQVHSWSDRIARNRRGREAGPLMDARDAMREFRAYVEGVLLRHRSDPASVSPLVATLLDAEQGEVLSDTELTAMFVILLFAGHETTTNLIARGMLALLENPDEWNKLRTDPGLSRDATEELLRYVSPVQWITREAAKSFEFEGYPIEMGDQVVGIVAAANRDPDIFANPDSLDILRPEAGEHIAFGFGIHHCLGQALARLEMRVAFTAIATRFPDLSLAVDPASLSWQGHAMLRRLTALPVRSVHS